METMEILKYLEEQATKVNRTIEKVKAKGCDEETSVYETGAFDGLIDFLKICGYDVGCTKDNDCKITSIEFTGKVTIRIK